VRHPPVPSALNARYDTQELMKRSDERFASLPNIEQLEVLASKLPS
jgi:hypothetical protein